MKIIHSYPSPPPPDSSVDKAKTAPKVKDRDQKAHEAAKAGKLSHTVSLSERSKIIQKAAEQLKQVPDIREEKVEGLRSKIQNGSYSVDPKELADKMLTEFYLQSPK